MNVALVSDVHLGTRQYGLKVRSEDFQSAFLDVAAKVAEIKPQMMVIGGDLFDSSRPDAASVLAAKQAVEMVKSKGVRVVGIDGNHDMAGGGWLRVIGAEPLDDGASVEIGGLKVRGLHYRNGRELIETLKCLADAGEHIDVLVMHFALAEMNGAGSADTGVQELLPIVEKLGVRCVLMGHVHIPNARFWGNVLFVNPGSTEMKSSNEPPDKMFYLVDLDDLGTQQVPVKTRKMVNLEINNEDDVLSFQSAIREEDKTTKACDKALYNVLADAEIKDVFKRLSQSVKECGAIARIVVCAKRDRDVAVKVDRKEGMATLESAIEARFPAGSQEAKLVSDFLRSPDNSAIHMRVEKFMKQDA